jgi:hypothetical protein
MAPLAHYYPEHQLTCGAPPRPAVLGAAIALGLLLASFL